MSLVERARKDLQRILANKAEWAVDVELTSGAQVAAITGTTSRRHVQIDTEGAEVNGALVNATVAEEHIASANPNYPIRNDEGDVAMVGHRVKVSDVSGDRNYYVRESYPDETLGAIVLILGSMESEG